MSKSKNDSPPNSLDELREVDIGEDKGAKSQVKLRPEFKMALHRVALHADIDMGILIEKYMTRFIMREDRRIAQENLAKDSGDEV
ncbi:hypothetical protein [Gemmata sp. SH-PL17]|uniref:hypothetical protein n=1 Tax=Gemmata sp. SH-PL17 TaxID=1630693 RepID=UPI0012F93258|nr:hypothetical protein [Gemmata sp. SH-PL17]